MPASGGSNPEFHTLSAIPTRKELRFLDEIAREELPHDPTPSLDEIAAQPEVPHMGTPGPAPQPIKRSVRVVVFGSDAALSAVLTRMMRGDYMWMEVAYIPVDPTSPAAVNWGITAENAVSNALHGAVHPVPAIRTDTSTVVAGSATLTRFTADDEGYVPEYLGEIVVDSSTMVLRTDDDTFARFFGQFGVRLVPMTDAPGIAAVPLVTPRESVGEVSRKDPQQLEQWRGSRWSSWRTRGKSATPNRVDGSRMMTGRAVQSGGMDILSTIDGVDHPRPLKRVTFYRHLRDMQVVRPSS